MILSLLRHQQGLEVRRPLSVTPESTIYWSHAFGPVTQMPKFLLKMKILIFPNLHNHRMAWMSACKILQWLTYSKGSTTIRDCFQWLIGLLEQYFHQIIGPDNSLLWGIVLCSILLATCLATLYSLDASRIPRPSVTTQNVSRHCQIVPWEQHHT